MDLTGILPSPDRLDSSDRASTAPTPHQPSGPSLVSMPLRQEATTTATSSDTEDPALPTHSREATEHNTPYPGDESRRNTLSLLRPSRGHASIQDCEDSHRQIKIDDRNFPKRIKAQSAVPVPQESSFGRFIVSIWEQIHGGLDLEPRSLVEQWKLTAIVANTSMSSTGPLSHDALFYPPTQVPLTPPSSTVNCCSSPPEDGNSAFRRSSEFCRRVTQASRTCRSVEVIVQARWIEHFDAYVEFLRIMHPDISPTKCRKAALIKACTDFGWSEKELRNKMAIWRGYKEIKEAGGWAALVFSGMGIYRLCKYRIGFNTDCLRQLMAFRPRFEVAADTLHPHWRQLLAIVGERQCQAQFTGHPHDWVVYQDGSEPAHLSSTYVDREPYFHFDHLDESVIDTNAWSADDPRWIPPAFPTSGPSGGSGPVVAIDRCTICGMEQSDDLKVNNCYCFPSLFGGPRSRPPIQVFHTTNGKRNGVQALVPFARGAAIGEFVGLVTKGIEGSDVMVSSAGGQDYQIWQGRQGNFTRFINHSCKANAQFQPFVWLGTQRIILVSKGIEAGTEITVDYSQSYWRGLDKTCLCGESCCRYNGQA